ncbi:MAG: hypothetical protein ACLQIB_54495 [Isosphaeraceae bacterium]
MFRLRGLLVTAGSFEAARISSCSAPKTDTRPAGNVQNGKPLRRLPRLIWHHPALWATACLWAGLQFQALGESPARPSLKLAGRTVTQDQGAWVVDYRLRYVGDSGIVVTPEKIGVKVEGWVSNSRVASHAAPRWSSLALARGSALAAVSEVIASVDESQRCRERLLVSVWAEDQASGNPTPSSRGVTATGAGSSPVPVSTSTARSMILPLSLGPEAIVCVRLRIDHQHMIYGDYDPLLAVRKVELALGNSVVRDVVALDREQYLAQPRFTWPEPPKERRDSRHAVSGPDSLHLEAHVPGHHYYQFPGRPVRYSSKMRLRFWYLIAAGTEGDCCVRVTQLKDTPTCWRTLHNGDYEQTLKTVGRWTKVERVIQTEPECTTLTVEFKIAGETEIGEMWIDDVSLEPAGCAAAYGP